MKKLGVLFLILFFTKGLLSQTYIDFPDLDNKRPDIDTLIFYEDYFLKVNVDTLYIINKEGVVQYQECRESYRSLLEECKKYESIGKLLNTVELEFDSLNSNLKFLEEKYELSLMENIKNNKILREQNEIINKNLDLALRDLEKANRKLKAERWKTIGAKVIWGAGGIIVGVLAGGTLIAISK